VSRNASFKLLVVIAIALAMVAGIILLTTWIRSKTITGLPPSKETVCANNRHNEWQRRTRLEQQGFDTGDSDPLRIPCDAFTKPYSRQLFPFQEVIPVRAETPSGVTE
jgi:hypothetical protein